jgi:type III secretion protein SpaR/YscT/HrcT
MDALLTLGTLGQAALLAGLVSTRIAVAFLLLPVFAPDTVPAGVRNAIFLAFGVLALALQPALAPGSLNAVQWIGLVAREALIGLALGFGLAAFLWAFEAAGHIVDVKMSIANGQIADPQAGESLTPTATLLARTAGMLFMAGGGFMLFVGVLVQSYALFPLGRTDFVPQRGAVALFEAHLADLMALALIVAAPALVVMFAIDLALGLVNRYAPQLNVITISQSLKGLASVAVWMLVLGHLAQAFGDEIARRLAALLPQLARVFGS